MGNPLALQQSSQTRRKRAALPDGPSQLEDLEEARRGGTFLKSEDLEKSCGAPPKSRDAISADSSLMGAAAGPF